MKDIKKLVGWRLGFPGSVRNWLAGRPPPVSNTRYPTVHLRKGRAGVADGQRRDDEARRNSTPSQLDVTAATLTRARAPPHTGVALAVCRFPSRSSRAVRDPDFLFFIRMFHRHSKNAVSLVRVSGIEASSTSAAGCSLGEQWFLSGANSSV